MCTYARLCALTALVNSDARVENVYVIERSPLGRICTVNFNVTAGVRLRARLDCLTKPSDISHLTKLLKIIVDFCDKYIK